MPGGWGEEGSEGLICPPSCSNKRSPTARSAHARRGRSEGEREPGLAHAHAGARQGGAGRIATGRREERRGRTWAGPGRRGGVGDSVEDGEEGDFSQLLVEELAGAPDLLPLGLWSGEL